MANNAIYKLGKKEAVQDPRNLKLARYFTPELPPPPPVCILSKPIGTKWPLYHNNDIGICAIASHAHHLMAMTANADGLNRMVIPPEVDVIRAYSQITGYNPKTGANDYGTVMLDALKFFKKYGLAGRKILGYAQVDFLNNEIFAQAIHLFGGVYAGIQLPMAAQHQDFWWAPVISRQRRGQYARGSWGGHAVCITDYAGTDIDEFIGFPTWGGMQRCSWLFKDAYFDEAWVIITEDWLNDQGKSPSGLDLVALNKDLAALN